MYGPQLALSMERLDARMLERWKGEADAQLRSR
jgi:hypothetical protein